MTDLDRFDFDLMILSADGKQLTSEIGLTLVNCDTSLNDHDKLTLTQMKDVIDAQIDQNIEPSKIFPAAIPMRMIVYFESLKCFAKCVESR